MDAHVETTNKFQKILRNTFTKVFLLPRHIAIAYAALIETAMKITFTT